MLRYSFRTSGVTPLAVARHRASRRLLRCDGRGDARLRRGVGGGRGAPGDRPVNAAESRRWFVHAESADRRRRARRPDVGVGESVCAVAAAVTAIRIWRMFFAGPATAGSIAPNVKVKPETGHNVDVGANVALGRATGGAYFFVNQYRDFIVQDLVVATTPAGGLAQATNYADVRIHGLELAASVPTVIESGVITVSGAGAFTRGTITSGVNPLDNSPSMVRRRTISPP